MTVKMRARDCDVGDWVQLSGQGDAIFVVEGKTQTDPLDNVEVRRLRGCASFEVGDVPGCEQVHRVVI